MKMVIDGHRGEEESSSRCIEDIEDLNFDDLEIPQPRQSVVPKVIHKKRPATTREDFIGDSFVPGQFIATPPPPAATTVDRYQP